MNDDDARIDREASDAIKRMERQKFLDGKLDKAYASEGAGILFLPLLLAAAGLVGWALTSLGLEGPEVAFVGALIPVGLVLLGAHLNR